MYTQQHSSRARHKKEKQNTHMQGLQGVFPGKNIILWQTEHVWKNSVGNGSPVMNSSNERMYLGAIVVDTKTFKEKDQFIKEVNAPFSKHSNYFSLNLFRDKPARIEQKSALLHLATELITWSKGLDLYSWGEDYRIFLQNIELKSLPKKAEKVRFHDIRHLFRAYGVPADNYLSSTINSYFGEETPFGDDHPVNNCRSIAVALKKLSQTV